MPTKEEIQRRINKLIQNREDETQRIEKLCSDARKYSYGCFSHNIHSVANEIQKLDAQIEILTALLSNIKLVEGLKNNSVNS
jgi:prefoldin subunit 5